MATQKTPSLLKTLQSLHRQPETGTEQLQPLLTQINKYHPDIQLSDMDYSSIAFVDDALTKALKHIDLDFRIEALIRNLAPQLALSAIKDDMNALFDLTALFDLIDQILHGGMGWSEDLGILGEQYINRVESIVKPCLTKESTSQNCLEM